MVITLVEVEVEGGEPVPVPLRGAVVRACGPVETEHIYSLAPTLAIMRWRERCGCAIQERGGGKGKRSLGEKWKGTTSRSQIDTGV